MFSLFLCQHYYIHFVDQGGMFAEDEPEHITRIRGVHDKKDGVVLLLCSGAGRIVFVFGDPSVFEMKLSKMLQRNLFSLGFSALSLLEVSRNYPHGIMAIPKGQTALTMELISRNEVPFREGLAWHEAKQTLMKTLTLCCSMMKVDFSEQPVRHKLSEVYKVSKPEVIDSQMESELVLVEARVAEAREIRTNQVDYQYLREQVLQEMQYQDIS